MESSYPIHATLLWYDTILQYVSYFVGAAVVLGGLSAWIAGEKHRGFGEGLLLGFLFGPLGVLVEALLPTGSPPKAAPEEWAMYQNQRVNKSLQKLLVVVILDELIELVSPYYRYLLGDTKLQPLLDFIKEHRTEVLSQSE